MREAVDFQEGRRILRVALGLDPRLAAYRTDPQLRFICNVGVLALGFDAPRANVVCVTRPTTSAHACSRPAPADPLPRLRAHDAR
jgi:hypothetical protein